MEKKNNWLIWSRFNYRLATQRTNRRNKVNTVMCIH